MGIFFGRIDISNSPNGDSHSWLIDSPITYTTDLGFQITVLAGATTDGASVPWWAKWLIPKLANPHVTAAAIIHDQLYATRGARFFTRAQSDSVFRQALCDAGVNSAKAGVMWLAVRLAGWYPWYKNSTYMHEYAYIEVHII